MVFGGARSSGIARGQVKDSLVVKVVSIWSGINLYNYKIGFDPL